MYPLINSNLRVFSKALLTEFEYALNNPEAPNLIPPKYLVTIHNTWFNLFFYKQSSIGFPAVPFGSLSSLNLFVLSIIYA